MTILAFGRMAPDGSLTTPVNLPVVVWAFANWHTKANRAMTTQILGFMALLFLESRILEMTVLLKTDTRLMNFDELTLKM
jgi:hypothetical protein